MSEGTGPQAAARAAGAARAVSRLAKVIEVSLAEADLTLPQYRALAFLHEHGDQAPSVLAGQLAVTRPTITALVDGLVARGWVERTPDPTDRRRVGHRLTPSGARMLATADAVAGERLAALADHHDRPERAIDHLARWQPALDRSRTAGSGGPSTMRT